MVGYSGEKEYCRNSRALKKILQVRGVTFDWRQDDFPDKKFKQGRDMGVIAQEIEKVFPEAVQTAPDGYKSVAYPELVAPLIEAVKELYKKFLRHDQIIELQQRELASVKEFKADKSEVQALMAENAQIKAEAKQAKAKADKAEKENARIKQENAVIKAYLCGKDPKAPICH